MSVILKMANGMVRLLIGMKMVRKEKREITRMENYVNKIISFLTLKNILLIIITSILATFITMIGVLHYLMDTLSWGMVIALLMIITIPFIIAHGVPKLPIVIFLREIHQSNLEDIKEQELKEAG